jgi:short subunit dehydrogenase-like uncharacterized protein
VPSNFLIYGSYGFVGTALTRMAIERGLHPILAGRSVEKLEAQISETHLEGLAFDLNNSSALDAALKDVVLVLNMAGPYRHTYKPVLEACLRTGTHYLDITGEISVYQGLAANDTKARQRGVMLLPGVGFDVVPTDCLALYLKQRLPSATQLTLALCPHGPGGLPPGTAKTVLDSLPGGATLVRRDGRITSAPWGKTRRIDFGRGPVEVTRMTWGDIFTAYYSTGIPNIEDYNRLSEINRRMLGMFQYTRPLFRLSVLRNLIFRLMPVGSTPEQRARSSMSAWGEVQDDQGGIASARLHGPEGSVIWTSMAALNAVQRVLSGDAPPGFQTPAKAYGADFVMQCEGVTREDID